MFKQRDNKGERWVASRTLVHPLTRDSTGLLLLLMPARPWARSRHPDRHPGSTALAGRQAGMHARRHRTHTRTIPFFFGEGGLQAGDQRTRLAPRHRVVVDRTRTRAGPGRVAAPQATWAARSRRTPFPGAERRRWAQVRLQACISRHREGKPPPQICPAGAKTEELFLRHRNGPDVSWLQPSLRTPALTPENPAEEAAGEREAPSVPCGARLSVSCLLLFACYSWERCTSTSIVRVRTQSSDSVSPIDAHALQGDCRGDLLTD